MFDQGRGSLTRERCWVFGAEGSGKDRGTGLCVDALSVVVSTEMLVLESRAVPVEEAGDG